MFPTSKFWWIRAHLKQRLGSEFRLCSTAALTLPYLFCVEAGLFLCVVVPGPVPPLTQPSVNQPAYKGLSRYRRKQRSLHHHLFEDCQSSGLQFKRESVFHKSKNVLWPNKTNAKLPFSCGFDPDKAPVWVWKKFSFYLEACGLRFEVVLNSVFNYQFWFRKQRC